MSDLVSRFAPRWRLVWLGLIALLVGMIPALACNFGTAPTSVSPTLSAPLISIHPITGTPGTLITIEGVGYPANDSLNLYLSTTVNLGSPFGAVNTDSNGAVTMTLTLPDQIDGITLSGGIPITITLASKDGTRTANAVFVMAGGVSPGTAAPVLTQGVAPTDSSGGGATSGVYITNPPVNAAIGGSTVAISGSAPAGNVSVQVQDSANNVLGSALVTSVAAPNQSLGTWQATITFNAPSGSNGFLVAIAGGQQASIPVTFVSAPAAIPSLAIVPLTPVPTQP